MQAFRDGHPVVRVCPDHRGAVTEVTSLAEFDRVMGSSPADLSLADRGFLDED